MTQLIHNTLSRFVDSGEIAGCSARIMRNDEVLFEESFGYADIESKLKMSADTIFPIASMSKVITVAGIMQLYEQGLFKLWDPVSKYLPGFKNPKIAKEKPDGSYEIVDAKGEVTMRQLFTMTSGVPYGWADTAAGRIRIEKEKEWMSNPLSFPGTVGYVNLVGQLPLAFEPGERWMYGFSIDVLGAVIEVLTGKSLGEYLKENVFDPLGMTDTGFFVPADKLDRIATLYNINEGMKPSDRGAPTSKPEFESGGGGMFSTVRDYSRFAQMLLHGGTLDGVRILGRKTIDLISTDHLTPEQRRSDNWDTQRGYGYGLGVRVMTNPELAGINGSVGEWGWDGAFGNWFCVDPKENLTCVYLTTNRPGEHYRFIPKLMASMYASLD
ncbi:serine hydrolase domain-containing protein [Aristaeella lactis]|uniref:CubicO group peptidase, beta-lactamase class C family n=1 Tax=Aristaeella lactis TaxID=3046383 RepID=A0AC61PNX8_9FIRM|nr:serine hydrolase domain-containing protein [Aristaeella lactis]QUA53345.1 beta-lactamase family protein [Aristaeella lactis]SMC79862.1 CubicO group peptidase, beta-lactamase class C family [Aristaeella lactis]